MMSNRFLQKIFCNESIVLVAILLNTLVIFLSGYFDDRLTFAWADALLTVFFVVEALVKITSHGWHNY